ncbi:amino acid permease [Mycobacterium sp. CVI_P3]|uniref:Amino acid permease n=1 Tax=Mycobacterium pinniadriaticum TaxID=2994102 RepID=A0ABT3SE35_9MYCO|nr:amino acid permease [Mycobacterium pinniadriaticum]MCX2930969.1 amino acid permease [Mycobacterium pinniadriaticum]MCX2937393.1 amino acid permease [Mycobacterium pinniadriaticum]
MTEPKGDGARLNRTLSLPMVTLYGLGNIVGAGIYVLVGKVAGFAGYSTTLAFLIAMVTAAVTALSYMELAGRYPVSASVSVYLHRAFGKRWFSTAIGLTMVGGGVASAAALAQGFAGYLNSFISVPTVVGSVGLLVALGAIAVKGIGESVTMAALLTGVEVAGLVLVIWFGRKAFVHIDAGRLLAIDPAVGLGGVVAGAFLAFYAFIGFEDMVNVAEEAKTPSKTIPLAILFALLASTVLYLLVVLVSTTLVSPAELAGSEAPLTLVFERSGASHGIFLSLFGVIAAMNGVIVQIIMGSRILYGLAKEGWISSRFAHVHGSYQTPVMATLVVVSAMIAATAVLELVSLARLTSLLVLIIFTLVNASLIVIKRRHREHQGYINVPAAIPYLGVALCLGTLVFQAFNW